MHVDSSCISFGVEKLLHLSQALFHTSFGDLNGIAISMRRRLKQPKATFEVILAFLGIPGKVI